MAASGGGFNYRNGTQRSSLKVDRPLSVNSNPKNSVKSKPLSSSAVVRRNSTGSIAASPKDDTGVPGRVRVAVRLRPRNSEELVADADFADCVELQSELKRLKLRKNNWDSDTFEFDEVLTEFASQKRVYEVVAKPVVESVLEGYNGTVMAYGQTGTGKTYTLGRLGEEDTAARGIMVRAMEDIFADISLETDSVAVSYLQLYMETIQDLLHPANDNIAIVEDPKSGDVSVPGATLIEIRDQQSFLELLRLGEAHRFAANTKLNTESSRSHAILMVHVKRHVKGKESTLSNENGNSHMVKNLKAPIVRKGKLVVVDLAGSERIDKSGSEGHTLEEAKSINLSLSALGKCINALAENSAHVPVRDSKLTRLLRDSFGGTARTSLVITIGPSPRHRGETSSTIMFGQRAMKVENMLKLKEEFDYKSLSRRLDIQLDKLIAEHERQQKAFKDEIERITVEAQNQISEVERNYADSLEKERLKYQKDYMESIKKLEEQLMMNQRNCGGEKITNGPKDDGANVTSNKENLSAIEEVVELKKLLQKETHLRKAAEEEVSNLKNQLSQWKRSETAGNAEILKLRTMLEDETHQKEKLEGEIAVLQSQLMQISFEADETRKRLDLNEPGRILGGIDSLMDQVRHPQLKDSGNEEKASIAKLFEQVGLQKILSLLEAEDADVRIHAVKVVANLAAEESNQEKIVQAGGLTSLLMLLKSSEEETIHRVAAGAIANLAMNESNQELIMAQGGISLLSMTAANAEDPQTLRMVAGAIANLCGNDKLQTKLRGEGGIKALLGMVRSGHPDVLAQVARGIANFAKCESRASTQGTKPRRSLLIEDGALPWIVQNANNDASAIRRHIELALCHLAQHEANAREMITGGALWELVRISRDCSREDIRNLAQKMLTSSPTFLAELRRLRIDY
ncbi:Armadillo repeat-containing kinesin-like protein 3 [Morus notabilis]|uniref:Kinesin-like protein n=1 Tax=Morus notabilis TaxID=981085 RepID=W9RYQ6_9ROSA|nr:kinesin-like protein KIN-UA [Morus notabilis]EXC17833.1 Armadillo repeat-containing kinesin-like protein 3 [Morus notabilis]